MLTRIQRDEEIADEDIIILEIGLEVMGLNSKVFTWNRIFSGVLQEDNGLVRNGGHGELTSVCIERSL